MVDCSLSQLLTQVIKKTLLKNKNCKSFTVAVSGGPDSMALAALSSILIREKKQRLNFPESKDQLFTQKIFFWKFMLDTD